MVSNVARDQYIIQQRESFLREVYATRTKARWLIWLGFGLFIAGFGIFAAGIIRFISQVFDVINDGPGPDSPELDLAGPEILGIPSALLGWALAGVGVVLLGLGIVLHLVATARRRRVDRELPLPQPGWGPGYRGG